MATSNSTHPRVKEVPDLDNVQPFFSDPILAAEDLGNSESQGSQPEATFTQTVQAVPYFYGSRPSIAEMIINDKVKRALATSWAFNPRACSTTAAQKHVVVPHHGLTEEEYTWIKGNKFSVLANAIKEKQNEAYLAKQSLDWNKHWVAFEPYPSFDEINIDQEFDSFYETGENTDYATTDQLTTDHLQATTDHENVGRDSTSTTWVTLPQGYRMIAGPLTSNTFHDSAIHMEDHFAAEANKESPPQSACTIPAQQIPDRDGNCDGNHLQGTVEDSLAQFEYSKQAPSGNEFEAPFDFSGFVSSDSDYSERETSRSVSDDVEMNEDGGSALHLNAVSPLVLNKNPEEASTSQQETALPQHINTDFDGYLHDKTNTVYPSWQDSLGVTPDYEAEAADTRAVSQEEFSEMQAPNHHAGIYYKDVPSIPSHSSETSIKMFGNLQANADGSSFGDPANSAMYHDGNYRSIYSPKTAITRQGEDQNLTLEYNSNSDINFNHVEATSSINFLDSTEKANNHVAVGDFNNPYDYRHYLPSNVLPSNGPQSMNLDFPTPSPPNTNVVNMVNPANDKHHVPNSMLVQPSLHSSMPTITNLPTSLVTIPHSSPSLLHINAGIPTTPSTFAIALSSPINFLSSTPTPVVMGNQDLGSPCPAPKNKSQDRIPGNQPIGESATAEKAEATKVPAENVVKDVFNTQQKRKVGRPVGSKTNKKTARESGTKNTKKNLGDASVELKKVRNASGTKKANFKAVTTNVPTSQGYTKALTTEEVAKETVDKHKQTEQGEPKKKRLRRPTRKSGENVAVAGK